MLLQKDGEMDATSTLLHFGSCSTKLDSSVQYNILYQECVRTDDPLPSNGILTIALEVESLN